MSTQQFDIVSTQEFDIMSTHESDIMSTQEFDIMGTQEFDIMSTQEFDIMSDQEFDITSTHEFVAKVFEDTKLWHCIGQHMYYKLTVTEMVIMFMISTMATSVCREHLPTVKPPI